MPQRNGFPQSSCIVFVYHYYHAIKVDYGEAQQGSDRQSPRLKTNFKEINSFLSVVLEMPTTHCIF